MALNLAGGDGFEFVMEPRAIQLHALDPGYGLVSHLSYVPSGYQNLAMLASLSEIDRETIVGRAKKDYDAMCEAEFDRPTAIRNGARSNDLLPHWRCDCA